MKSGRRRLRRILRWSAAALIALVIGAAIATKYWIAPAIVRGRIEDVSARYWDGTVRIGAIDFNYLGPTRVRDIRLLDRQGRVHASAAAVTLKLEDLTSSSPVLAEAVVNDLHLHAHRVAGKLVLPLRLSDDGDTDGQIDLKSLQIWDVSLTLHEEGVAKRRFGPVHVLGRGETGSCVVTLLIGPKDRPSLSLHATVRSISDRQLDISVRESKDSPPYTEELRMTVSRDAPDGRGGSAKWSATVAGGKLDGSLSVEAPPGGAFQYTGRIEADRIDLKKLSQVLHMRKLAGSGILTGKLSFRGGGTGLEGLRGRGLLQLEGVPARRDPLTHKLFGLLNGTGIVNEPTSDVQAVFTLRGAVATLQDAILADTLRVMKVERGGTINLQTREIDLYIITMQLRGVSGLLSRIPVVKLATIPFDKLTRVHVTGTWDDQVIRKEPVKDIAAATRDILREAIQTGGQIGPGVHGIFRNVFRALQDVGTTRPRAETGPPAKDPG